MSPSVLPAPLRRSLAIATLAGLTLTACKKGEEAAPEEAAGPEPVKEAAPPQPAGPNAVASEQCRSTQYSAGFGGGGDEGSADGREGGMAGGPAATTLARVVPLQIVGQKLRNSVGGKPFVELDAGMDMGMGGEGDRGDESGAPSAARPHPLATSVQSSLGATVTLTYDANGEIAKVDGVQQQVYSKVLRGVPRTMLALVGGMFSETVFREAMMFHGPLNGGEVKQGDTWTQSEKGMLMLNWQQDFVLQHLRRNEGLARARGGRA
jgi:hypothetical protein